MSLLRAFYSPGYPSSPDTVYLMGLLSPDKVLNTVEDELQLLVALYAVPMIPYFYRMFLTLASTHAASIAPRYVSTVLGSFEHTTDKCLSADSAPEDVQATRKAAFEDLIEKNKKLFPTSEKIYAKVEGKFSDIRFFDVKKVFFPFRSMAKRLAVCVVAKATDGPYLIDVDDQKILDVSGSYGVNVIGYEGFKSVVNRAHEESLKNMGPVLGPVHPDLPEALRLLTEVAGLPEASLHMSGTEAVMCATRLARFNTKKPLIAAFGSAYHGWYDAVQPGVGNERHPNDLIVLKDMSDMSLRTLRARASEIACVLVNPLQAFTPNQPPPSDGTLIGKARDSGVEGAKKAFTTWLQKLRKVCDDTGIVLLYDEVYTGFRLARGGAQEYFGVKADMVAYGKSVAGGQPIGAVCGPAWLMRRYDPDHPLRLCYLVGTFSAHPAIVTCMRKFLEDVKKIDYQKKHDMFDVWVSTMNGEMEKRGFPVRLAHFSSVWLFQYTEPGRFHWLMQYYLRTRMVNLAWVGTGRLSFSLDFEQKHLDELKKSIIAACEDMQAGGWWWTSGENHASVIKSHVNKEIMYSVVCSAMTHIGKLFGGGKVKRV